MHTILTNAAVAAAVAACASGARAQGVTIETVHVGNPGNIAELSGQSVFMYGNATGTGVDRACGAVTYPYEMGRYEVTAAQYVAFLNAVAATDTYGLYVDWMDAGVNGTYPMHIARSGSPGSYTYS